MDKESYKILYKIEKDHWWFKGRRRILDSLIKKLDFESKKTPLILDAGCSVGITLNFLQRYGLVCGFDVCEEALKICHDQNLFRILQADAHNLPFLDESCDLLIALDLLEHLGDDSQGLEEFKRVLKKGGYLIISVPAYKFLWTDFDFYAHHFRRYSIKELKEKVCRKEFTIRKLSHVNWFLFFVVVIKRMTEKIFRTKAASMSNFKVPTKIINTILEKIFSYEANFINIDGFSFPFGSSIFCVAQKQKVEKK